MEKGSLCLSYFYVEVLERVSHTKRSLVYLLSECREQFVLACGVNISGVSERVRRRRRRRDQKEGAIRVNEGKCGGRRW